jgi:hypothetical protein
MVKAVELLGGFFYAQKGGKMELSRKLGNPAIRMGLCF